MSTFAFSDEPQTLRIFNYAADTQEFIGVSDVYIAPNTGLPECCTTIEPPECQSGFALTFNGETWLAVEDHRGKTAFDTDAGSEVQLHHLGPLPDNVTLLKPDNAFVRWDGKRWRPDIEKARQAKVAEIKQYRDRITADYIIIDNHHFHSDANSRIQQLSLTKMGVAKQIPAGLMWQTKNHNLIELTNEIAARFETETMAHDMRLFAAAQQHIAAVEALTEVQAVMGYDYSSGWQP
ncbi:TPA: DUF4376 domain-containing protein [Escherichia coli]|nr:DUF4376 domain-containing protein [Escherichia coli]